MRPPPTPSLPRSPQARLRVCFFLATAFAVFLAGCASPGPYRDGHKLPIIERHQGPDGYSIGYVELDEQGWLWSQPEPGVHYGSQLLQVQHFISREANLTAEGHTARGIILVAFVHGWKNNGSAAPANNVGQFKTMLETLAHEQSALPENQRRKVVGVYVGWPGLSATPEPFLELSFYSRKNAADRVGNYGGVTQVLCTLEKLHTAINASLAPGAPQSCFVTAGHSFGAQVVYGAVSQILMQRLVEAGVVADIKLKAEAVPDDATGEAHAIRQEISRTTLVKPFGDLVLLVNPAFEAARYENLWRLSRHFVYANPAQRPVFAIFSSETDSATRTWFPIGRYTSTLFERYREDSLHDEQKRANHHTVPWIDLYVTHYLRSEKDPAAPPPRGESAALRSDGRDTDSVAWLGHVIAAWDANTRAGTLDLAHFTLTPVQADPRLWTPFYVVRASPSIIDGHSGIWQTSFTEFLVKFISAANPPRYAAAL